MSPTIIPKGKTTHPYAQQIKKTKNKGNRYLSLNKN